ncbi:winged helix-turn-helix domain-containing protein [Vibrio europaeus]|jgi:DNA-binding transcriptional ArsR family regulator|uniref:Transcriptional regulator n=1 Tax=Vibrio europaeus TaxID=300876 RepID=A0A178J9X0_9VIBR|nr:winged helix-turn-helix domain-containing protein [Vibrio europaeus]MDC5704901.1 winged helix-turn-helix domain-containing protein [Vibrio europaeus]MDC5710180.1 winged helix-turn-helix domain-containing protein [Vibrio europaeus]MDC5715270.1 winged helix-turn-helix domain-containing protein [Vibrio europaeus]MDC5718876.1 winged helix-turn-helix domain-containing protein [Vibrio europaeus]MDC5724681.1 winged helix-turn-helix domain-containing protein [Vibrio europaeus]
MSNPCSSANTKAFESSEQDLALEQKFSAQAKALSHPARVRIVKILLNLEKLGGCLNSDLVSELGLAQSTVSEHLRILKQAGFISAESIPPKVCYRVDKTEIEHFSNRYASIFS